MSGTPERQLRIWQETALREWLPSRRGIARVTTGAGKTIFALECFDRLRASVPWLRLRVLVPSLALRQQWVESLESRFPEMHVAITWPSFEEAQIAVVVVNSMRSRDWGTGTSQAMLVADECHRYATNRNGRALDGDWYATLGLSATPERQYDSGLTDILVPALGDVFFTYTTRQALEDHVLTPFEMLNYKVPLTDAESANFSKLSTRLAVLYRRGFTNDDDAVKRLLIRRSRDNQRVASRIPVTAALIDQHRARRALIFHESTDAADALRAELQQRGHRVGIYHSKMSDVARLKALKLFLTGQTDVLVTCRALDEGLDVPDVDLAIISASSNSRRQRIQRMGRVLRTAAGKERSSLMTLYALESERDLLESEAARLAGVASVRWFAADLSA